MKGIWKYSDLLPPVKGSAKISLGEGGTPLIKSRQIGPKLGIENLYFKLETVNPSGSYKDRFAACAVSHLLNGSAKFCLATSSGNTGSALAAYCAAANMRCFLAIVDGAPIGKIQQMQVYGSETLMIKNFGKDMDVSKKVFLALNGAAEKYGTSVQISAYCFCPQGMAGVQTVAYEIAENMPYGGGHIFSPAGGGGLTLALTKGFQSWKEHRPTYEGPRVHCVQPLGNDTISGPLRDGLPRAQTVPQSTTSISGLQVPTVLDGDEVIANCRATGGTGFTVEDQLIYKCQEDLAVKEGIFCEPAGAVALAGFISALKNDTLSKRDQVVCIVTGHGFKDLTSAKEIARKTYDHYYPDIDETLKYIESQIQL